MAYPSTLHWSAFWSTLDELCQFLAGGPSQGTLLQSHDIPLLSNFEVYKKSLPVRRVFATGKKLVLYQIPYFTYEEDLEALARKLMEGNPRCWAGVQYLAAPSASGKTACILPAFLRSTEMEELSFTHYIYLPFHNHDGREFTVRRS